MKDLKVDLVKDGTLQDTVRKWRHTNRFLFHPTPQLVNTHPFKLTGQTSEALEGK